MTIAVGLTAELLFSATYATFTSAVQVTNNTFVTGFWVTPTVTPTVTPVSSQQMAEVTIVGTNTGNFLWGYDVNHDQSLPTDDTIDIGFNSFPSRRAVVTFPFGSYPSIISANVDLYLSTGSQDRKLQIYGVHTPINISNTNWDWSNLQILDSSNLLFEDFITANARQNYILDTANFQSFNNSGGNLILFKTKNDDTDLTNVFQTLYLRPDDPSIRPVFHITYDPTLPSPTTVPTATVIPTNTPVPTFTPTDIPPIVNTPTNTPPAVPTVTDIPSVPTDTPTNTPVPTSTPIPVNTLTPTPT